MTDFASKSFTAGQLNSLVKKLGGEQAVKDYLSGKVELSFSQKEAIKRLERLYADETILVGPTTGEETIAEAKDTFDGWLDPNFVNWGTNKQSGVAAGEVAVEVHEMCQDSTFEQMFRSLGDPDELCLEQGQIVDFSLKHRDKLRQGGYGTFFLFRMGGNHVPFVAGVCVGAGGLLVSVFRLEDGCVLDGDYRLRVVVPQLAT